MTVKKAFFAYSEKYERLVLTVRSRNARSRSFCGGCGKEVGWLTLNEVSRVTGKDPAELSRMIADGEIEYLINDDCEFLVCAESAFRNKLKIK